MFEDRPGVFIVEDEPLVLADLEDTLTDLGYRVAHKARNLVDGLILAQQRDIQVAILDVNLSGLSSARIADTLDERNIPFLLVTGYGPGNVPHRLKDVLCLAKPVENAALGKALDDLLRKAPTGQPN
jgi:DNA-binding response OmpR family regulator